DASTEVSPDPPTFKNFTRPEVAPLTKAYADLIFAFGLARMGEDSESRKLQQAAEKVLDVKDPVHAFLWQAYSYRIDQGIQRKPHGGPLPTELLERLERLETRPRYAIDRLRQHSRVLDPHEHVDVFRRMAIKGIKDDLERELVMLGDV